MRPLLACCLVFLPLRHVQVNSSYGYRIHPVTGKYALHAGTDFHARHDTVFAIMDGLVSQVSFDHLTGLNIRIDHDDLNSLYGHLSQVFVSRGRFIAGGAAIGITGSTGRVTGEHLHFAIAYRGRPVDPIKFLYQILNFKYHE